MVEFVTENFESNQNSVDPQLAPEFQEMLGLKGKSLKIAGPITRGILTSLRMALGPASPMEEAAIARLIRIGELPKDYSVN